MKVYILLFFDKDPNEYPSVIGAYKELSLAEEAESLLIEFGEDPNSLTIYEEEVIE